MRWICPLGCAVLSIACASATPDDDAGTTDGSPTAATGPEGGADADGGPGSNGDPDSDGDTDSDGDPSSDGDPGSDGDPSSDDGETAGPVDTSGAPGSTTDDPPPANQLPPVGAAELLPWLESLAYADWHAESAVHPSSGPHGDGVRTFFNEALRGSFEAGDTTHPIDAAVVKELYDGGEIAGWAVMVKLADGGGGDTWYWYEIIGASTYADGTGVELCSGCHADGVDQIQTPYPLQ